MQTMIVIYGVRSLAKTMLVLALMALCSVAANESPAAAAAAPPPEPHTSNRNLDDYRKIHAFFDAMQVDCLLFCLVFLYHD